MTRKSLVFEPELAYSTEGKLYQLDYTDKRARLVARPQTGFIENLEEAGLDETVEKNNTRILFQFLKARYPDTAMRLGRIHIADYKIRYRSHGFEIRDTRKFGELINANEWHNDHPTPEEVLAFISTTLNRPVAVTPPTKQEVERGELMRLASLGRLTIKPVKGMPEPILKKQPKKKERLHMELEKIYLSYKDGRLKYREATVKINKRAPIELRKPLTGILAKFTKKEITWRQVLIHVKNTVGEYQRAKEERRAAEPVRQPKFEPPPLWEPIKVKAVAANVWHVASSVTKGTGTTIHVDLPRVEVRPINTELSEGYNSHFSTGIVDPDIVWLQFETRGPAGKRYEVTATLEEYLANVVLHHFPRAMAYLMKVATGESNRIPCRELSMTAFVRDPFQPYDQLKIRYPLDRWEFCRACFDILAENEVEWFGNWWYSQELEVKDKVKVYSPARAVLDYGTVVSTEAGVSIRYEYGTVEKIRLGEIVEKYNWK